MGRSPCQLIFVCGQVGDFLKISHCIYVRYVIKIVCFSDRMGPLTADGTHSPENGVKKGDLKPEKSVRDFGEHLLRLARPPRHHHGGS